MPLQPEQWFPQVIWVGALDLVDNDLIEKFAYDKKTTDPGVSVSNYGGWQSTGIGRGENVAFDNLVDYLNAEIDLCCQQTGLPDLELYNIWININGPGSYNHLHNHAGALLSGVYYVKSKPEQGNIFFERGDDAEYFLPPMMNPNIFTSTATVKKSTTNALYVFPGWLKHSVQPNQTQEDRISISFNYGLKK